MFSDRALLSACFDPALWKILRKPLRCALKLVSSLAWNDQEIKGFLVAAKSCTVSVTAQLQQPAKMSCSGRRLFGVVDSRIPWGCPFHTAAEPAKLETSSWLYPAITSERGAEDTSALGKANM